MTRRFTAALLLIVVLVPFVAHGAEWYVAPNGSDTNAGTKDQPFASIARARDEIRKQKPPKGATIWLRGGTYYVTETIQFQAADSGTAEAPVVFRAMESERPVLVGGRAVRNWRTWRNGVLQTDLKEQGLSTSVKQLFYQNQRQPLARYPNFDASNPYGGGWAYADGKPIPMYEDVPGESKRSLQYRAQDARTWARPDAVEVFVFPRYNWWNNIVRVQSIDPSNRLVTLVGDCSYPIRPGDRYYFQNALEELDAPGEWYCDDQAGVLYFWPPDAGLSASDLEKPGHQVTIPLVRTILAAEKVEHVSFRGLTLQCAGESAISLHDSAHCQVLGCTIRLVGHYHGSAVGVNRGHHNSVIGCDIYDVGSNAISLAGGDRKTLASAENVADNNYIHHAGVFYKQGVGVSLNGVGNRASHNLIHDCPRFGILFSGNNLVLEYNHIRHVNLETEDTGAVYTGGRDWISSRGTVVRYNFFHDILGYGKDASGKWVSPHFAWGVYLDDNTGGVDVIGNVVARCSRAGLHLHNGRDNLIENNVFFDNGLQQFEYNGWRPEQHFWTSHFPTMVQGYESVAGEPAWKSMRNMQLHPKDAVLPDGNIMSGNVFQRNIVAGRNDAKLLSLRNVSFANNQFDRNLYFAYGRPMKTGFPAAGKVVSDNLCPNGGFESGEPGKMPEAWQWQIRPTPSATAGIDASGATAGKLSLRMDAAFNADKPRDNYPIVVTRDLELKLGGLYRLRAMVRATEPNASAKLMLQSYVANAYFWGSYPHELKPTSEWKPFEFLFQIPAPGDKGHHPQMKQFRVRVDFPDKSGSLFVDAVQLHEIESLDEWAGWQKQGNDAHSLVADPQFENPDQDDLRLKPSSPAIRELKFQPIPWEKIGPYSDEYRASWPIVEAEGAREKPLSP